MSLLFNQNSCYTATPLIGCFPHGTIDLSFLFLNFHQIQTSKIPQTFQEAGNSSSLLNQLEDLKTQLRIALQENEILRSKSNFIESEQMLNTRDSLKNQENSDKSFNQIKQEIKSSKKHERQGKKISQDRKRKKFDKSQEESYNPQGQQKIQSLKKQVTYKICDTKNIIKNFSRAFITYFLKHREIANRILNKHEIENKEQFYRYLKLKRQKIESICSLRQVWLQQQNKYAKIMRVLSFEYLRKRYLHHTLHSKIKNVSRTIKYRQKLMESIKRPQQFTLMKQF